MTDSISGGLEISGRDLTGARFGERLKRIAYWLSQRNVFDLASCVALASLVILAVWTFQDYAISNDEGVQHRYGELIVAYYKSGFTDQSVFKLDNLYLYGGLFDLLGLGLSYIIPVDQYELRHLLCALIGIGGIGAAPPPPGSSRARAQPFSPLWRWRCAARGTAQCTTTPRASACRIHGGGDVFPHPCKPPCRLRVCAT